MNFEWSPSQVELHVRAEKFARQRMQRSKSLVDSSALERDRWRELADFGLLGLTVPVIYGGSGLDSLTASYVLEGIGRGAEDLGLAFASMAHLLACGMPLSTSGSEELRRTWLPRLCSGQVIAANAITEPEAGSDVFALKTRAVKEGDRYVLSGTKSYVSNASIADLFLVYATIDPGIGFMGVTAFLVERNCPGLEIGKPFEKLGLKSSSMASIYLNGCSILESNRLGAEGQGAAIFSESMQWERSCLFAVYLGAMQRVLDKTVLYVRQREQFGRSLAANQSISHRLVDLNLRIESARLLLYRACWLRDQGRDATAEVSMAKLSISETAVELGKETIQIHGGLGIIYDSGVATFLEDAIPGRIVSGTSEMQREIISKYMGLS